MKKVLTFIAMMAAVMTFMSCDRYDDGRPSKDVRSEFNKMYPDAFDVEWEWDGTYWEVTFETGSRPNGIEKEAWYDKAGNWIMTSTDMLLSMVPQNITEFLAMNPNYGTASIVDAEVEYIETPSGNFYRFELSVAGRKVKVDVNVNGVVSPAK
jgi:hypothetical protein